MGVNTKIYPTGDVSPHASTHEPGGSDEVFGIPAAPHALSHISGGDLLPDATALTRGLMTAAYAGKVNAQFYIDPNTIHVDKNRTDSYTEDGSPTFPFKTIQAGVTHGETTCSSSNPVMILIEPGIYDENVVLRKEGIHLRGRGTPYDVTIQPTTGSGLTYTNATAPSLALYNTTGVYSNLVNQGDAGPLRSGVWGISISSPVGNSSPPVRLLGVKGDTGANTTGFALGLYIEHCAVLTANAVAAPIYIRNANTVVIDVETYINGTAPITIINTNRINLSNSWVQGDISTTWNSADPNGTPFFTSSKYIYGKNTRVNNVLISGEAGLDDVFSWDIKYDATLSGTSTFNGYECLVRRNLTIGAGCAFNFDASGIIGDLTIDIAANACTMDGGDLMGTTTDPGSHLTRNVTKHQTAHVTGNDQLPDVSAITRGLMTPAQLASLNTLIPHAHTGVDGTGKLTQANSHQSPDTDVGVASLHHTIGVGAFQAAAGNHDHLNFVKTDGTRGLTATGSIAGAGTVSTAGSSTLVTTTGNAFANLAEWDTITANGITRQIYVKLDNNNVEVNEAVDWSATFAWTWNQALHLHFQTDVNDRTERGLTWNDVTGATTWQLYTWFDEGDEFLGFYNARSGFDTLIFTEAGRFSLNRTSDSVPRVATDVCPNLFSIFPQYYAYVFYTTDNAAFADNTIQAGQSIGTPFTFLDSTIADRTKNWTYLAMSRKWQTCWLAFTAPGVAGWTTRLEYWKTGVGWNPVVLTSDDTSNFTQVGAITWDKNDPGGAGDDWGTNSVGGSEDLYWIRVGSLTVPPALNTISIQAIGPNAIPRFAVYQSANDSIPGMFIDPRGRVSIGGSDLVGNNLFQIAARTLMGTINSSENEALAGFYSAIPTRKAVQNQLASDDSTYPVFGLANSRGTLITPTALMVGDTLGGLEFKGYTNIWVEVGEVKCEVDGVPGVGGDLPTRLTFWTTPSGGGGYVERLRIAQDGLISTPGTMQAGTFKGTTFDTNVAAAKLTIAGTTITAAGTDANVNVTLAPKGTGTIVASSKRITSLADPSGAQDAATRNYADTTFSIKAHAHAGGGDGTSKLPQSNTHESVDTDVGPTSIHHTLGTGANQAAAGNHAHTGIYSPVAHTHDGTGNNGPQLAQTNTHQSPDTDVGPTSLHHTLGTGATQAATGDHLHTGVYTPTTHNHNGTGNNGPQLAQADTHLTPDTDAGASSLHHTLGTGANQAASGTHDHSVIKLSQANTHQSPDTDVGPTSLHHTLGTGANQAAAGDHLHTGVYTPTAHNHDGTGNNGPKLTQAVSHESPDTDGATTSLHHTLGTGANQAAAGNHLHTGVYSPVGHTHTKANITDFVEADYVHVTGNETVAGNKTFTGNIIKNSPGSVVLVNGANNNIAIGNGYLISITGPTGNFNITGIAGGVAGRQILLWNTTANNCTLNNENAGSVAANRINTMAGNIATAGTGIFTLIYDGASSRWLLTSTQA